MNDTEIRLSHLTTSMYQRVANIERYLKMPKHPFDDTDGSEERAVRYTMREEKAWLLSLLKETP